MTEDVAAKRPFGSHITVKQRRGSLEWSSRAGKMAKSGSIERLCSNPILQNKGVDLRIGDLGAAFPIPRHNNLNGGVRSLGSQGKSSEGIRFDPNGSTQFG